MRVCIKLSMIFLLIAGLFACEQKKSQSVFLEKDGNLYEVNDHVSFYHPKSFSMNVTSENKNVIEFINDQEMIYYKTIIDDTDNKVEDMPALYAGALEQEGAIDVYYQSMTIESGLVCQEFTGIFGATGVKFKHLVYFTPDYSYMLCYQAPDKVYDDQIDIITQYLVSLVVS